MKTLFKLFISSLTVLLALATSAEPYYTNTEIENLSLDTVTNSKSSIQPLNENNSEQETTSLAQTNTEQNNSNINLNWTYNKEDILNFLNDWRNQSQTNPYLDERERDLRTQFIDRLLFQIDRKYYGENLRKFLINATWDMALTDEMKVNRVYETDALFLKNLHSALKHLIEPSENVLSFLRSFTEFSSVRRPKPFDDFAQSRAYTNGTEIIPASDLSIQDSIENAQPEIEKLENLQDQESKSSNSLSTTSPSPSPSPSPSHIDSPNQSSSMLIGQKENDNAQKHPPSKISANTSLPSEVSKTSTENNMSTANPQRVPIDKDSNSVINFKQNLLSEYSLNENLYENEPNLYDHKYPNNSKLEFNNQNFTNKSKFEIDNFEQSNNNELELDKYDFSETRN